MKEGNGQIVNLGITHFLDSHGEELQVSVNTWYGVQWFSVGVNPTRGRPLAGERV